MGCCCWVSLPRNVHVLVHMHVLPEQGAVCRLLTLQRVHAGREGCGAQPQRVVALIRFRVGQRVEALPEVELPWLVVQTLAPAQG